MTFYLIKVACSVVQDGRDSNELNYSIRHTTGAKFKPRAGEIFLSYFNAFSGECGRSSAAMGQNIFFA